MKKLFLLTAALFLFGYSASAQFKLGAKAGMNISTLAVDGEKALLGANVGLIGQIKFGDSKFAIQPEVLFSMQGNKFKDVLYYEPDFFPGGFVVDELSIKLNYVLIPVMVQYYVAPGFNLELGPQLGFLASAKAKVKVGGESESGSIKSVANNVDFTFNFGAAYELPAIPLGFYARYSLGVTNVMKDDDGGNNRVFQFGAFVRF